MTRDELYQTFGPILLEAIVLIIRDEINILRNQHGLPERTNEQIRNVISDRLSTLEEYAWMKDVP